MVAGLKWSTLQNTRGCPLFKNKGLSQANSALTTRRSANHLVGWAAR
jgi:hypothetical protein